MKTKSYSIFFFPSDEALTSLFPPLGGGWGVEKGTAGLDDLIFSTPQAVSVVRAELSVTGRFVLASTLQP